MEKLNKVLLIDDDPVNNYLNEKIFRKKGLAEKVVVLTNGQKAVDYLKNCKSLEMPDLILLDLYMPVMDGFEFFETFRSSFTKKVYPKIILLTSVLNQKDKLKARELGLKWFFQKPLKKDDIESIIHIVSDKKFLCI